MNDWAGKPDSTSEHRTTGRRAYCLQCNEWCYPELLCDCCDHIGKILVAASDLEEWSRAVWEEVGLDAVVRGISKYLDRREGME